MSKKFAGLNHQYNDIYHTKKQTEIIPRSCSNLLENTVLFYIAVYSEPYLESGSCKLDKELDNCNFYLFSQETGLLKKVIMKFVNIKLWDLLGCFHYILNAPRILAK